MKGLNSLISWLYIMLTIFLGIYLIFAVTGWYGLKDNTEFLVGTLLHSSRGVWAGFSLIVLGLVFLAIRLRANSVTKRISFDNPEGEVTVSMKAVEDFVRRVGQEFAQVLEITPSIMPVHDGVKISAKVSLAGGINVPRFAESLQREIKVRIQNVLGIENITSVEVHVNKIISKGKTTDQPEQANLNLNEVAEESVSLQS